MTKPIQDFTKEDPWRVFRIMSEFVDGFETMSRVKNGVTFFGSARTKPDNLYYKMAYQTATLLVKAGYSIITGAGSGIMEAANKGAKEAQGESVGLNILIPKRQTPNKYITQLLEFKYFFCRKVLFVKYSKALVAFPGGYGTLDEFSEAITLIQTNRIVPFPVILFGSKYWMPLYNWMQDAMLKNGNIDTEDLKLFSMTDSPHEVVSIIKKFKIPNKKRFPIL